MNALIEFTIITSVSFFLFMFLGYMDAARLKKPSGPIAMLFNYLKFWKSEDEIGIRGYLFRQNIIVKLLVAFIAAAIIRIVYSFFFDFSSASETFDIFTGASAYLIQVLVIFAAIITSYLWPQVKSKVLAMKEDTIKIDKSNTKVVEAKVEEVEPEVEEPKVITPPDPSQEKPKDSPDDIINDYLK